ncbi:MAG: Tyrosine-tRNA ligase [Candidatus Uhrbacteria bacterium GW2011_GWD2_41_121]|uniref:Tyrosine--tRNA ligase n=1 Tax=Candidatus Uhrbacteria bacterium GW2011_GWC1_41_20 TaxID=1618983 RepID=A0A0G0VDC0_9BACT|nr:MAG: Tyrosine-tRNA ligase [Candidatus Uhrbacteria bacterium GW2011_GWE1_39_46]KKR63799.1 MAG: Tyrosine-tRNA ligase [Candidatus Uhrbacteria bacterium GW2011_GWC2_40_450]KKR89307.1 MAG: Tyrosine-tRNA ligase [Candidatus Uhrbacteria bacterium GW2011_GWE2_41_1153]KKR89897.1 MAG: Tyrosine-tRNA ligase [Candidatus Uhrbacteria bacterium GW2011_GWD2_41_121]KKR95767.1 MAG: Tyrosine-tRNA ligase [Candidatus Uhrbacteria bacterium GW2011_GWD1_41_16]KKR98889.1 MAG: Tyrosine-tRNA ligase [Candidatus Uhrbacte
MSVSKDQNKIQEILTRGVEQVYPKSEMLGARLKEGKKLRLYVGIDPTGKDLHIGHALQLRKLKQFQDLGHEVIMLIGSFTGMIGDPTDKSAARQKLTRQQVLENAATYKKQASRILSFSGKNPAKIMFNHKWLGKLTFEEIVDLASNFTVQQMLERDMFDRRLKEGKPIYLHEFFYPLMQGYDSVAMDVDLEVGGSDQTFNMLAGRTLMKAVNNKEKMVMTLKLITNDEGKKMSKSEGGFVALNDAPKEMYGKIMAMDDSVIIPYFELATDVSMSEIAGKKIQMEQGVNPRDIKADLAFAVVRLFHDEKSAQVAREHFATVFQKHETPEEMNEVNVSAPEPILDVLVRSRLVMSKNEARRMIEQGGVKLDGAVVENIDLTVEGTPEGKVLQKGKRHFVKLVK